MAQGSAHVPAPAPVLHLSRCLCGQTCDLQPHVALLVPPTLPFEKARQDKIRGGETRETSDLPLLFSFLRALEKKREREIRIAFARHTAFLDEWAECQDKFLP